MITIKSAAEIQKMDAAGRIVEGTLKLMERLVRVGISTAELDREAEKYIRAQVAEPSFLGYGGYPKSICTSVNEQVVHGIPGGYHLKNGDIISVDVGVYIDGYHGDAARTFLVGEVPDEVRELVRVTKACFFEGLKYARVGYRLGDIGAAIQEHAESHGYGVVRELVGHGIGRNMHEDPEVPNYGRAGRGLRLEKGMTIAIEPMINLGTAHVYQLSDGWTVVAADGKPSAHYENSIAITDGDPVLLTLHEEAPEA